MKHTPLKDHVGPSIDRLTDEQVQEKLINSASRSNPNRLDDRLRLEAIYQADEDRHAKMLNEFRKWYESIDSFDDYTITGIAFAAFETGYKANES